MATIPPDPSAGARDYNRIRMAKKQNSDPAAAPRRRATKAPAIVPSSDNAMVSPPLSLSGNGGSTANDSSAERLAPEPSYDDIAQAAYLRYLNRGGGHGSDFDDW